MIIYENKKFKIVDLSEGPDVNEIEWLGAGGSCSCTCCSCDDC